jgi:hypothetical protein
MAAGSVADEWQPKDNGEVVIQAIISRVDLKTSSAVFVVATLAE